MALPGNGTIPAAWKRPEPKIKHGDLSRYAKLATSASTGAVLKAD